MPDPAPEPLPTDTILVLSGVGVVPYSTRGASQTLEPIEQARANVYRDVNGVLRSTAGTAFQKYKSTITCSDQRPIAADGVWPGKTVTVDCIVQLAYLTEGGTAARDEVEGSSYTEGVFTFYRPALDMMVTGFSIEEDEFGAEIGWRMELEEV